MSKSIKTNPGERFHVANVPPKKHSRKHSATDGTTMDLNIGDSPGFGGQNLLLLLGENHSSYCSKWLMFPWLTSPLTLTGAIPLYTNMYMDVSENSGTPKSSILIRFSIVNHPFWGNPIFGNTHIYIYIPWEIHPRHSDHQGSVATAHSSCEWHFEFHPKVVGRSARKLTQKKIAGFPYTNVDPPKKN